MRPARQRTTAALATPSAVASPGVLHLSAAIHACRVLVEPERRTSMVTSSRTSRIAAPSVEPAASVARAIAIFSVPATVSALSLSASHAPRRTGGYDREATWMPLPSLLLMQTVSPLFLVGSAPVSALPSVVPRTSASAVDTSTANAFGFHSAHSPEREQRQPEGGGADDEQDDQAQRGDRYPCLHLNPVGREVGPSCRQPEQPQKQLVDQRHAKDEGGQQDHDAERGNNRSLLDLHYYSSRL